MFRARRHVDTVRKSARQTQHPVVTTQVERFKSERVERQEHALIGNGKAVEERDANVPCPVRGRHRRGPIGGGKHRRSRENLVRRLQATFRPTVLIQPTRDERHLFMTCHRR